MMKYLLPWQVDRVAVRDNLDDLTINRDGIITNRLDISEENAKGGVILEEVGSLLNTSGVVDGNNI